MKTKLKQRFKVASFTLPNGDRIHYKLIGNLWYYAGNSAMVEYGANPQGLYNDTTARTLLEITPVKFSILMHYATSLGVDKKSIAIAIHEWELYA